MAGTRDKVIVSTYTNGILGPNGPMLGPVRDGGVIEANTMPGCWGPMITPHLRGGHEVTQPVAVENAEPGDAVAIKIRDHPRERMGYVVIDPPLWKTYSIKV